MSVSLASSSRSFVCSPFWLPCLDFDSYTYTYVPYFLKHPLYSSYHNNSHSERDNIRCSPPLGSPNLERIRSSYALYLHTRSSTIKVFKGTHCSIDVTIFIDLAGAVAKNFYAILSSRTFSLRVWPACWSVVRSCPPIHLLPFWVLQNPAVAIARLAFRTRSWPTFAILIASHAAFAESWLASKALTQSLAPLSRCRGALHSRLHSWRLCAQCLPTHAYL